MLLVMIKMLFVTSEQPKRYKLWSCQKMCDALHYLLDDIFIIFGSIFFRQIVGIPMVLIVLLLLQICICYVMRDFMTLCCGIVSSKIYDKLDDFNFEIVNFSFLDGEVPRSPSYGVYISQLIFFC